MLDFVHNIEFSDDVKPKLEVKKEPMDMESSLKQPIADFDMNNKQVLVQNFSDTLEAAMLWSNFRDRHLMKILEIPNVPNKLKSLEIYGASYEDYDDYEFSQFVASILPEFPLTYVSTPSLVCRAPPSQNQDQKVKFKFCVFCKNDDEVYYPSHKGLMTCENHCFLCQGNKNVVGHNTHSCPKLKGEDCGQKEHIQFHSNYPYLNINEFHFDTVATIGGVPAQGGGEGMGLGAGQPIKIQAKDFTEAEKAAIVDECTVEMYSPTLLAEKYNINVTSIRGWIKSAGKSLPQKYKFNSTKKQTKPSMPSSAQSMLPLSSGFGQ